MPPKPTTQELMVRLTRQGGMDKWHALQISNLIELYERKILEVTPNELGRMICKISPGKGRLVMDTIVKIRDRYARKSKSTVQANSVAQKLKCLADVKTATTEADICRVKTVSDAASALLSL